MTKRQEFVQFARPYKYTARPCLVTIFLAASMFACAFPIQATPANRIGMDRYFEKFLSKSLNACTTCHLPLVAGKTPDSLLNFPHNPFGRRLADLGEDL